MKARILCTPAECESWQLSMSRAIIVSHVSGPALIHLAGMLGGNDDDRLERLLSFKPGQELDVTEVQYFDGSSGLVESDSLYLKQKLLAESWKLRQTVFTGIVQRCLRSYCFQVELPEGMLGRLQFCDLAGNTPEKRLERRDSIRLGQKVHLTVKSVCAWPAALEIFVQEFERASLLSA